MKTRALKEAIRDPLVGGRRRAKARDPRRRRKRSNWVMIGLSLLLGFAGGWSVGRFVRWL
jgi:hypothetical protein